MGEAFAIIPSIIKRIFPQIFMFSYGNILIIGLLCQRSKSLDSSFIDEFNSFWVYLAMSDAFAIIPSIIKRIFP